MSMSALATSDGRNACSAGCWRFPVLGADGGNTGSVVQPMTIAQRANMEQAEIPGCADTQAFLISCSRRKRRTALWCFNDRWAVNYTPPLGRESSFRNSASDTTYHWRGSTAV